MERATLVIVEFDRKYGASWPLADEQAEMEELMRSAGVQVVEVIHAPRHVPVAATLVGSGKLEEIHQRAHASKSGVVIFNQEFSPAQQRNAEEVLGVKTIDRTQLILDIFAQRAKSQEGKIQVELAQSRYLLPRLVGKGIALSRLGGGIGTRGPGEQKLEVDRRRIRNHISRLEDQLTKLTRQRQATRQRRKDAHAAVVALVGYTNVGKSTLLNALSGGLGGRVENRLFTTLDPLARRVRLPGGGWMILTDTVGFLHRLPHHLIEAFKATLEETRDADVLLHLMDASHPLVMEQADAVREVLRMLNLEGKSVITVLNKVDRVPDSNVLASLSRQLPNPVPISALKGDGLDVLLRRIEEQLALVPSE